MNGPLIHSLPLISLPLSLSSTPFPISPCSRWARSSPWCPTGPWEERSLPLPPQSTPSNTCSPLVSWCTHVSVCVCRTFLAGLLLLSPRHRRRRRCNAAVLVAWQQGAGCLQTNEVDWMKYRFGHGCVWLVPRSHGRRALFSRPPQKNLFTFVVVSPSWWQFAGRVLRQASKREQNNWMFTKHCKPEIGKYMDFIGAKSVKLVLQH